MILDTEDAFVFLVKLRMNLVFYTIHDVAFVAVEHDGESYEEAYNVNGDGELEATRRAIIRAAAPVVEPPKSETLELLSDRLDKFADTLPHGALQSDIYAASYIYKKHLNQQSSLAEKIERIREAKKVMMYSDYEVVAYNRALDLALVILEDKSGMIEPLYLHPQPSLAEKSERIRALMPIEYRTETYKEGFFTGVRCALEILEDKP